LELRSCRCGILTIFFILNALVGDRQWHSFWAQRLLFACEVTTGPLDFLRRGCCSLSQVVSVVLILLVVLMAGQTAKWGISPIHVWNKAISVSFIQCYPTWP
jgi:hypothetical protein